MKRHPFDPLSFGLGLIALAAGTLTALDRVSAVDYDASAWLTALVLVFGLSLIPWNRRREASLGDSAHGGRPTPPTPMPDAAE